MGSIVFSVIGRVALIVAFLITVKFLVLLLTQGELPFLEKIGINSDSLGWLFPTVTPVLFWLGGYARVKSESVRLRLLVELERAVRLDRFHALPSSGQQVHEAFLEWVRTGDTTFRRSSKDVFGAVIEVIELILFGSILFGGVAFLSPELALAIVVLVIAGGFFYGKATFRQMRKLRELEEARGKEYGETRSSLMERLGQDETPGGDEAVKLISRDYEAEYQEYERLKRLSSKAMMPIIYGLLGAAFSSLFLLWKRSDFEIEQISTLVILLFCLRFMASLVQSGVGSVQRFIKNFDLAEEIGRL